MGATARSGGAREWFVSICSASNKVLTYLTLELLNTRGAFQTEMNGTKSARAGANR